MLRRRLSSSAATRAFSSKSAGEEMPAAEALRLSPVMGCCGENVGVWWGKGAWRLFGWG